MAESGIAAGCQTINFLWTIKDFRNWCLDEDCFPSTRYLRTVNPLEKTLIVGFQLWCSSNWKLCLGIDTKSTNGDLDASVKLSLLDTEFCLFHERYKKHTFSKISTSVFFYDYIDLDIALDNDNKLLHNGNLILYIEISRDVDPEVKHEHKSAPGTENLQSVMNLLLEKENFSDFTVHVKGKEFLCHKFVLACRCEYFAAMFKNIFKENDESKLFLTYIEDLSIFEKIVRYIYTGEVNLSETEAFQLFVIADKYGLNRLKALCEENIHSSLCLENALKIFLLARFHSLENLKLKAFLIVRDFTHVFISDFSNFPGYTEKNSRSDKGTTVESCMQELTSHLAINSKTPESVFFKYKTGSKKTFLPKVDVWCRTYRTLLSNGTWKFRKFHGRYSCTFDCDGIPCKIHTRTRTFNDNGKKLTELYLCFKYASSKSTAFLPYIHYKFSVLNAEGKETNSIRGSCRKAENECFEVRFFDDIGAILSSDDLLHGEDLIVSYKLFITKSDWCHINARPAVPKCSLVDDMSSLLGNKSFTDAVIKIGEETFPCHKAILSCYSSFLCSKFQESSSKETVIEVDDIKPTTFRKILSAMYTGKCELSATEVWELLPLEDKYNFFNTTSTFDEAFVSALSTENAVEALVLTASQKSMKLQKYALEFIFRNSQNVLQSGLMQ